MRKVFLDTNVVLDAAIPERENNESANAILSACDYKDIEGFVSFLTVANAAYLLKKGRTEKEMVKALRETLDGLTILPMDNSQVEQAYKVEAPDFEDVLQYECAKAGGCEVIVTANTKHFKFVKDIDVVATEDYAQQFIETEELNGEPKS